MRRALLLGAGLTGTALVLAGCGGDQLKAAPNASDPACTSLISALPGSVLGRARTSTKVTGAAEWGDPAIVLRCGVTVLGPTTEPCETVDDVDWVIRQTKKYNVFVSYGRTPATEVDVPVSIEASSASGALVDLNDAVNATPKNTRHCIGLGDPSASG